MNDTSDTSVFWDSTLFVVVGILLTFFYVQWVNWSTTFFYKKNPEAGVKQRERMLKPWRVWFVRIAGIIAILFGALGAWVTSGHSIPGLSD